jgi:hypothetical protein
MPLPVYWSHGPNRRDQKVRWKVGRETEKCLENTYMSHRSLPCSFSMAVTHDGSLGVTALPGIRLMERPTGLMVYAGSLSCLEVASGSFLEFSCS